MSAAAAPTDLDPLIIAYLADDIDQASLAELDRRLRQDAGAAQRFARFSSAEIILAAALRMRAGAPATPIPRHPPSPMRRQPGRMARSPSWWPYAAAAALLAVVIASFAGLQGRGQGGPAPEASVVRVAGHAEVRSASGISRLWAGAELHGGDRVELAAGAQLRALRADGSTLDLAGGSVLLVQAAAAGRFELAQGGLTVVAAHQPAGTALVFATPQASAEVVGTTLRLIASEAATRLEVSAGRVRLQRRVDGQSVMVDADFAVTATAVADQPLSVRRIGSLADGAPSDARIHLATRFDERPAGWDGDLAQAPVAPPGRIAIATHLVQPGTRFYGEIRSPVLAPPLLAGERTMLRFRYLADGFAGGDRIKFMLKRADGVIYHGFLVPRLGGWQTATVRLAGGFYAIEATHRPLPAGEAISACVFLAAAPDGMVAQPGPRLWLAEVLIFTAGEDLMADPLDGGS